MPALDSRGLWTDIQYFFPVLDLTGIGYPTEVTHGSCTIYASKLHLSSGTVVKQMLA